MCEEKVTVKIGRAGKNSTVNVRFKRGDGADRQFLQDVFKISYKRAQRLIDTMNKSGAGTQCLILDLNYRQLARYSAMRRVPNDMYEYWKAANILEHIENDEPVPDTGPIEMRPGRRTVPSD